MQLVALLVPNFNKEVASWTTNAGMICKARRPAHFHRTSKYDLAMTLGLWVASLYRLMSMIAKILMSPLKKTKLTQQRKPTCRMNTMMRKKSMTQGLNKRFRRLKVTSWQVVIWLRTTRLRRTQWLRATEARSNTSRRILHRCINNLSMITIKET